MKKKIILGFGITILIIGFWSLTHNTKAKLPEIDTGFKKELKSYLQENYLTPEQYIICKFDKHDIVFLGEFHKIKHDVELIQNLIPELYSAGVYTLALESINYEDQERLNRLITADEYDEALAYDIQFGRWTAWGYQEYIDIYKAAWELNHKLDDGEKKFRIVGLNCKVDFTKPGWQNIATAGDQYMANIVLKEIWDKKEKALIFCGINHAYTKFKQPTNNNVKGGTIYLFDKRMGNLVYNIVGNKCMTIFLHSPWNGKGTDLVYPVDGLIDALMVDMGKDYMPMGVDTHGTPFGELTGDTSFFSEGYENFNLKTYCDGYIFTKPISEYEGVEVAEGFINNGNYEEALRQMPNKKWSKYVHSPWGVEKIMKSTSNIDKRFQEFK